MNKDKFPLMLSKTKDIPLLMFLWRWKVSTTAVLSQVFYPERSPHCAYQRLWKLEKAGFIQCRVYESRPVFIWMLDKRGYALVRNQLTQMREEGYLSQSPGKDLLITAIHFGDGIFGENKAIEYFTKQELERLDSEFFPDWVPQSKYHPDGYWKVSHGDGHKVIALEMALCFKTSTEYECLADRYSDMDEIHQVIWVCERSSLLNKIHDATRRYSTRIYKHSFVLLDQIYDQGWQAPIVCGQNAGSTLNEILQNSPRTDLKQVLSQFSLDTRKTPYKSKYCELFRL